MQNLILLERALGEPKRPKEHEKGKIFISTHINESRTVT